MGLGTFRRSGTGLENLGVVRVGSEEPSGCSGMGRGTLPEVLDGSGDPRGSSVCFGGPSWRSGMGRGTL